VGGRGHISLCIDRKFGKPPICPTGAGSAQYDRSFRKLTVQKTSKKSKIFPKKIQIGLFFFVILLKTRRKTPSRILPFCWLGHQKIKVVALWSDALFDAFFDAPAEASKTGASKSWAFFLRDFT